ncbi:MAG: LemA family protein [Steroidobacteraceae bacterium]
MSESSANAGRGARRVHVAWFFVAIVVIAAAVVGIRSYNEIVAMQERATGAWSQVVSNFQRRRDLVPMLVETVSSYLKHEKDRFTAVTGLRRPQAQNLQRLLDDLATANAPMPKGGAEGGERSASLEQLAAAERRLSDALQGIVAVVEDYPELRSFEHFSMLQSQLEGTENRINVARLRFNEAAEVYNRRIRRIPGNLVAAVSGFELQPYFLADEAIEHASEADFR